MRILAADSWSRVRFALHAMLEEQPGLRVVGQMAAIRDLRVQVEVTCPDLLRLSWELPDWSGVELLFLLRKLGPGLCIVILGGRRAALAAGANAFVSKIAPPEGLLAVIEAAQRLCDAGRPLD